ncbi:cytochrome P450 2D26-like [Mya arenaria]|uniref:cytochrome P450 2D26-like n=1 Tax=Mya arenaria TaxID=6604 RepID=UPI0022E8EAA9|nr:cytochrome P450 2D26-like [Mya arenaria]
MFALYAFILVLSAYWIYKISKSRIKKVPGPKGLPIVGKGLEFNSSNLLQKFDELSKEYGDFFLVNLFGIDYLILNSENAIREVLTDTHLKAYTNDRSPTFWGEYAYYGSQSVAFYQEGYSHVHSKMRKYIAKGLHFYGEDGRDIFESNVFSELGNFAKKIERLRVRGEEADMMALIQRSLSNVVSVALSGEVIPEGNEDEDMFWKIIDTNSYFLANARDAILSALPILRFLPGPYSRMWQRLNDGKAKVIKNYFVSQKKTHISGKPRGICDMFFDAQEEEKADGDMVLTDERVISNILEVVVAGIITSWSLLSSTMFLLLHHPEFQDRLAKELQAVAGQGEEVTSKDKVKSPLMEALELETHRLLLVNPTLLTRLSRKDVEYKGWMPFGLGKRSCIGEPFARARYFLYVATLLRNWRLCPSKDQPLRDYDPRHVENFDIEFTLSGEAIPEGDKDEDMFWKIIDTNSYFLANARNALLTALPVLRFLPGPYSRMWQRLNDGKAKIIKNYYVSQKKTHIPGKPRGICDTFFDAQEAEKADGDVVLTDERVISNILEVVVAGIITTWSLLSSTMFLLLHHPEFQDRLAKELQAVAKQGEEITSRD